MSVLTLAEAKTHLNIPASNTASDAEVQAFIDAAEAAVVNRCGPLASTTVSERVDGYRGWLILSKTPVVSITTVTPVGGTVLSSTDFDPDLAAGLIRTLSGSGFPQSRYDVVYQAGRASVPADLLMAVKEQTRHMWRTQLGDPVASGFFTDGQQVGGGPSSGWSPVALKMMEPYLRAKI